MIPLKPNFNSPIVVSENIQVERLKFALASKPKEFILMNKADLFDPMSGLATRGSRKFQTLSNASKAKTGTPMTEIPTEESDGAPGRARHEIAMNSIRNIKAARDGNAGPEEAKKPKEIVVVGSNAHQAAHELAHVVQQRGARGETTGTNVDITVGDTATGVLKKGDRVALVGFGSFSASKRAARTGRNPQTGAEIKIAAKNVAKFKAGADLAGKVN